MNTELKQKFVKMLAAMEDERFANLPSVIEESAPEVSVRLNPRKQSLGNSEEDVEGAVMREASDNSVVREATDNSVIREAAEGTAVAWWGNGRYLSRRPKFTLDPSIHQGVYYVQDASSMILATIASALAERISKETEETEETGDVAKAETTTSQERKTEARLPILWLDACAAPGGKTTAAIDALPYGSLVVANEFDYQRAEILKENVAKWGSPDVVVSRGDTALYAKLPELFDVIAVDAPCSGEGMMRKDVVAREQWTPALVEECATRQREILENLWKALRPGGYLVYSTCTFNTRENEEMILWLMDEYGAEPVDLGISAPGIDGPVGIPGRPDSQQLPAMRFIPGRARGEGLFVCVVRKPGESKPALASLSNSKKEKKQKGKASKGGKPAVDLQQVRKWISPALASDYAIHAEESVVRAFPSQWAPLLPKMDKALNLIAKGVELAEIKGRDFIPTQALAMSISQNASAFPSVELSMAEAQTYLARESVTLPDSTPKGFVLLTYGGRPLGFVKNLGNRSNNLYPKEWRIRSL